MLICCGGPKAWGKSSDSYVMAYMIFRGVEESMSGHVIEIVGDGRAKIECGAGKPD